MAISLSASLLANVFAKWGTNESMVVASVGTVFATVALVYSTFKLVNVTKELTPEPLIVPALWFFGSNVFLELHNVGSGAAIDIDVTIEWKVGSNVAVSDDKVRWRATDLPPGGRVRFNPRPVNEIHLQVDSLQLFDRVSVAGTMRNSRQKVIDIFRVIDKPAEFYTFEVGAKRQYPSNYEPSEIVADEMQKIRKLLEEGLKK